MPEYYPKNKARDKLNINAYPSSADTPKPPKIESLISKILSGDETGDYSAMTLHYSINVMYSRNTFTKPNTATGKYI